MVEILSAAQKLSSNPDNVEPTDIVPDDPMTYIESALTDIMGSEKSKHSVRFRIEWRVAEFLKADGCPTEKNLRNMLTLSGRESCACAVPFEQYLSKTWRTGSIMLECYLDAFYRQQNRELGLE